MRSGTVINSLGPTMRPCAPCRNRSPLWDSLPVLGTWVGIGLFCSSPSIGQDFVGGVLMRMAIGKIQLEVNSIGVTTTGSEFHVGTDGGISCFQRIPSRRLVAEIFLPADAVPMKLQQHDDFACGLAGNGVDLSIHGDSVLIIRIGRDMHLTFRGLFRPAYHATKDGNRLFIDGQGGFGIYPVSKKQTSEPDFAATSWDVRYEVKAGEEIWLSVFPPRPYNWKRAFEHIEHEGGEGELPFVKPIYPGDDVIRSAARFCTVFAVHSSIWPGGDRAPWLIPRFVPTDMNEFTRMRDDIHRRGMKLVPYFSPYYYRGPDFFAEVRRAVEEYKVDGLYFDGISMDFRKSYRMIRQARKMLGDDRILYVHCSTDPLGSPRIFCPFIDAYADYILRGEAGRGDLDLDSFLRWTVSGHNISNTVGYWCYYGSTGEPGYVQKIPSSEHIDAALRNEVRIWRTAVSWKRHGADVDAFDREYYGKLAPLRLEGNRRAPTPQ